MATSISETFSSIKDPRIDRKKLHSLSDILVLTLQLHKNTELKVFYAAIQV